MNLDSLTAAELMQHASGGKDSEAVIQACLQRLKTEQNKQLADMLLEAALIAAANCSYETVSLYLDDLLKYKRETRGSSYPDDDASRTLMGIASSALVFSNVELFLAVARHLANVSFEEQYFDDERNLMLGLAQDHRFRPGFETRDIVISGSHSFARNMYDHLKNTRN